MSAILDMATLYYENKNNIPFVFIPSSKWDQLDIYGNLELCTNYKIKDLKWDTYDAEGWQNKDSYEFVIENEYFVKPVSFMFIKFSHSSDAVYYKSRILYKNCSFDSEYNGNGGRLTFKDCIWRG